MIIAEKEDKENTDLVKALNGLYWGLGSYEKVCGILTGGIAVIELYPGKGERGEYYGKIFNLC
ncbi:C-GCAxxG-C-C family protein [Clostridium ljungdahlii]|uniref:Putative redox-active protein (C_GCAxxG_C_C) n=1 Tax=Clostridium ljungdahlii TaxID=1538 RepID=A0A168LZY6_9CLOT|nr:C-GCAxxG-C-C family protein [Clostridium ljungdahlii]OAA83923.1 putative redox-active protein (C_GCAxxG_C_C) [Clostridium ljungdahlii]